MTKKTSATAPPKPGADEALNGKGAAEPTDEEVAATVSDAVADRLKESYQKLKDEPVPDRFLELLQQLDERVEGDADESGA